MTKFFPEIRAAVTTGGWVTLVVDPNSYVVHFWLGSCKTGEEVYKAFYEHVKDTYDFICGTICKSPDDESRKEDLTNFGKWLKGFLNAEKQGEKFNTRHATVYGNGITCMGVFKRRILCFVPWYQSDDPHTVAVLAHEIIHVANRIKEGMSITDGNLEFIANTHTTLFKRLVYLTSKTEVADIITNDSEEKKKPSKEVKK